MEILQHIWGSTPEGEGIILYTMRNSRGSEVQLCNIGASIVSVKFADRHGNIDDVALGYKDTLMVSERERKGLDASAKIPELEVAK